MSPKSKRKREYYRIGPSGTKQKSVENGISGIFFTCDSSEHKAVREAYNLLEQILEELGYSESCEVNASESSNSSKRMVNTDASKECGSTDSENCEGDKEIDIADSIKRFCDARKNLTTLEQKQRRSVIQRPSGASHCLFFKLKGISGPKVHKVADKLVEMATESPCCRALQRVFPIEITCPVNIKNVREEVFKIINNYLLDADKEQSPPSFAVEFKARNNDLLRRTDVLDVVTEAFRSLSPNSRVNLTKPEVTVLVQVVRKTVMLSCIRHFMERKRMSLHPARNSDPVECSDIKENVIDEKLIPEETEKSVPSLPEKSLDDNR
ncbi:hypothetical protein AB6A40_007286 [Gnathostoma spinigerum]|uniref:THUMP domain-containing protein n=1 Tax=Gnathostoma spinigerum TaxID=75299 RepID=A0ABD6EMZ3_9BILA